MFLADGGRDTLTNRILRRYASTHAAAPIPQVPNRVLEAPSHMKRSHLLLLPCFLLTAAIPSAGRAAGPDPEVTKKALDVLNRNCALCHGPGGKNEANIDYILDPKKLIENGKIKPGDSKHSRLYMKVSSGAMPPPEDAPPLPRPSKEDIALLGSWIDGGDPSTAPPPVAVKEEKRGYVTLKDNLQAMLAHQQRTDPRYRQYQRYFTFTNLYNNPAVTPKDMRIYEAALAKLLNSLSWKPAVVVPVPIDEKRTVFVVDTRKLDWAERGKRGYFPAHPNLWREVLKAYPYGLKHNHYPDDEETNNIALDLYKLAGTPLPAVRADWFIATASRGDAIGDKEAELGHGLYDTLLQLPNTAAELEQILQVNFEEDFNSDDFTRMARAGFTASGVSKHNRLIERHETPYGAYWKSYDFKGDDGTDNLINYPLGPKFAHNPYNEQAFVQAGGEFIFNLPNGLQGYMLVKGDDTRIDEGPIDVVRDKDETSGSVLVVNGLSCMRCHDQGMRRDFNKDDIREGTSVKGEAHDKVRRLYPDKAQMDKLLDQDTERFLKGMDLAAGLYLKVGEDADKEISSFPDMIGALASRYRNDDIDLNKAACELGLDDPKILKALIESNSELSDLGLQAMARGSKIKREFWESVKGTTSTFQEAARIIHRGTPQVER